MQYISVLGRQPEISLAELESVLGADKVQAKDEYAILDSLPDMDRLGGSIKLAEYIGNFKDIQDVFSEIEKGIEGIEGKIKLGLSAYSMKPKEINAKLLDFKRKMKKSMRIVPNRAPTLNSAQVIRNKLVSEKGAEYIWFKDGTLAKTVAVQDIDSYSKRDRQKPVRDSKIGMLPPKLAVIMLNLAGFDKNMTVLDPFCGTGTVLMEAHRLGGKVLGSDINPAMVKGARDNLEWLGLENPQIEQADAQNHKWPPTDVVVSETDLGPGLHSPPSSKMVFRLKRDSKNLIFYSLKNLHEQLKPGSGLCIAIPAWQTKDNLETLDIIDDIQRLGYNLVGFKSTDKPLIYKRPQQIVARQLLVLRRN